MKILPSLGPAAPDTQLAARGSAAVSFAELLEGGAPARELLARRALGFAEAGLLGVHFAHPQVTAEPALAMHPVAADGYALAMISAAGPAISGGIAIAPPVRETHCRAVGPPSPGLTIARSLPPEARAGEATGPAAGGSRPAAATCRKGARAERTREPARAPAQPQMPPPVLHRSPVQIRLAGGSPALTVVVEGFLSRKESIPDLEATARAIASEYGMQISHLAVKQSRAGKKS